MVVNFSIGNKSKAIISQLQKTVDNVEFMTQSSISELVKDASLRHIEYKRVILSTAIISNPDKEFLELNNFIKEYSALTEVVLVMDQKALGVMDVAFNKLFNAPMYTPVLLPKANSKVLLELINGEIVALKTKYYEPYMSKVEKVEETIEEEPLNAESESVSESSGTSIENTNSRFSSGPASIGVNNYNNFENSDLKEDGSTTSGSGDDTFDDSDLNLSDLGQDHSDTGFLDLDEDEELKKSIDNVLEEKNKREQQEKTQVTKKEEQEPEVREEIHPVEDDTKSVSNLSSLNIDLVISTRGNRATQAIVDESLELYRKDDGKILIIDLDYTENRILSLLSTDEFYRQSKFEGITKQRIYTEDNIYVCSNGFGVLVSIKDLKALLLNKGMSKFDLILIDCPVDCLKVIDEELISIMHVLVYSGGETKDMMEMSAGLCNRANVRLGVERSIMSKCAVELSSNAKKSEIRFIQENCVFANGCWLDKVVG